MESAKTHLPPFYTSKPLKQSDSRQQNKRLLGLKALVKAKIFSKQTESDPLPFLFLTLNNSITSEQQERE